VTPIEPHVPGRGFKLVLTDGDVCEVTGKPRTTTFLLPCSPNSKHRVENFRAMRAMEGTKENVCRYMVEFPPTQFGCPVDGGGGKPTLTAVQGCVDSLPLRTTEDCHYAARTQLSLHGLKLHLLCPDGSENHFSSSRCTRSFRQRYTVHVGPHTCGDPTVISQFTLNCTLDRGTGKGLDVVVYKTNSEGRKVVVMELGGAVSFKDAIDFREKFAKFTELGVGGLKKEIEELYRRAFASRGVSQELLGKMGITHVKGILLYGPPGTGKTLIARTIAKILGSKQVQLINGPEIISKYLGESERNLRAHFEAAQKAWKEHGALSELFVIIIDEIDAICKPRGKTDQSAAGVAYDALVNQLLTLMDGLNEAHNTMVVGLTNRRELLDTALLRPGRFEVQIEVSLPDEEGREEIFEIHTRSMQAAGMLGGDVDLRQLAAATGRFSGAEIAGVVRSASAFALERYQSSLSSEESVLVTAADFQQAIISINPAYTHSEAS
ncbi:Vesicle-fusing ATPase, partial [Geodia barretti]